MSDPAWLVEGAWVRLADERAARILAVVGDEVEVAMPSGDRQTWPLSYAASRWGPLPADGFSVFVATDRPGALRFADADPVGLLLAVLDDTPNEAKDVAAIRAAMRPILEGDAFVRWWRKTQPKLETDPRIDASDSRRRRYRRATSASAVGAREVSLVGEEVRGGRRLADGPQLREARRIGAAKTVPDDALAMLRRVARLADRRDLDPTDRFMAAELGVWIAERPANAAQDVLGEDLDAVDLLRIPQHGSKTRALSWAIERLGDSERRPTGREPVLLSAVAAGEPWRGTALAWATSAGLPSSNLWLGALGWSVPGSEEAGPPKFPDDLETYARRVDSARADLAGRTAGELRGMIQGAIVGLARLAEPRIQVQRWHDVMSHLAIAIWEAWHRLPGSEQRIFDGIDTMRPDGLDALIRQSPGDEARALRASIVRAYIREPGRYGPVLRAFAERLGLDPVRLALDAAKASIKGTQATHIVADAFLWGTDARRTDEVFAESVSLAGTLGVDDPRVTAMLRRTADEAAERMLVGDADLGRSVWFDADGWRRFSGRLLDRLERAARREAEAVAERDRLRDENVRLEAAARARSEALSATRAEAAGASRDSTARLASGLLKPVAHSLADSYESGSLEALRDRLLAVLARARIEMGDPVGAVVPFDPRRHEWVGEGRPGAMVEIRSPGFTARMEGDDAVVLVAARVTAPRVDR